MSKSLRLSEKWFRFGLWLVALVFSSFLIGLGGTVIERLPKVEQRATLEDFIDQSAANTTRVAIQQTQKNRQEAQEKREQAQLQHHAARANAATAHDSFNNWLATRHVTQRAEQDTELLARAQKLDELKAAERQALANVEAQQQAELDAQQAETHAQSRLQALEEAAANDLSTALRNQELRIFLYRLALTLPLLAVAGWLFVKQRQSIYWPFVWGFIYFALFAFFVELVPYLPSYGGTVRYGVGILLTVLVGRQGIIGLKRYLERQKLNEALPDVERRKELSYDTALARLAKNVCPGCERPLDMKNTAIDYCPHCGICLYEHCARCQQRKSAFARFCHACGSAAREKSAG